MLETAMEYIILKMDIYDGDWKNYIREGQGIYIYPNGNRYEGEFKNHKFEGNGIFLL